MVRVTVAGCPVGVTVGVTVGVGVGIRDGTTVQSLQQVWTQIGRSP